MKQNCAEVMQRIVSNGLAKHYVTKTVQEIVNDGIGTIKGKTAYFTEADHAEMSAWLLSKGYSVTPAPLGGLSRRRCTEHTPYEKAGGAPVKRNRVSVKSLFGQPLIVGGETVNLPPQTHLDAEWTALIGKVGHSSILLVENYESFDRIHETRFELPPEYGSPIVLYRGDPYESRTGNAMEFLRAMGLPVLAYVDADPAGLVIANSLPNLVGMVAPPSEKLDQILGDPKTGRQDLYWMQLAFVEKLDGLPANSPLMPVWQTIRRHRAGSTQEHHAWDLCVLHR